MRKRRKVARGYFFAMLSLASITATSAYAAALKCSQPEAIKAEEQSSSLRDWDAVYAAFRRYSHCDDGAISEGYSESVGNIMANRWDLTPRLTELINRSPAFGRFVLKHLDETVPEENWRRIARNVGGKCPPGSARTCALIKAKVN